VPGKGLYLYHAKGLDLRDPVRQGGIHSAQALHIAISGKSKDSAHGHVTLIQQVF
jgi:hypothetical protein